MKLALICTERLPSPAIRGGAIQTMIDGVLPYLQQDHDVTVFSVTDPELDDEEIAEGVRHIRVPADRYVSGICERLAEENFDLIHVFNRPQNIPAYHEAAPTAKIVLGLHNDMMQEKKISAELGSQVVNMANRIATVSNYIKQTVIRRFPEAEEKIHVVYSGVDLDEYPPVWSEEGEAIRESVRQRYRIENRKVILFAGRLSQNKGAHILIRAMPDVLKKHRDAVLVIAGGKWFSDNGMNRYIHSLYRLAKPLGNRVIFTKYIPTRKMPELFLASDVFVCPSQWQEPLARVHYEAMAAGIPVITTNRGGNPEVILHGQNGLLIDACDRPADFAKAIDYVFSNAETASWIARNGRKFVELNFQFTHVADRLERVYQEAIHSPVGEPVEVKFSELHYLGTRKAQKDCENR
jgi:glycosyltransferase involved in cell wall biosynthesis